MSRFFLFFGVLVLILGGSHYYLWARLVRDPGLPQPWAGILTGLLVVLALLVPLTFFLMRRLPQNAVEPFELVAFSWLGIGLLMVTAVFFSDVVRWLLAGGMAVAAAAGRPVDPIRRELLARGLAGAAVVAGGGMAALALRKGTGEVETREVEVKLARLPRQLSGLTMVQVSDIHVGGVTLNRRFIEQMVDRIGSIKPDAIFITGDLVDGSVEELADQVEPLGKLAARYGVYFVTGNHEYYSGVEQWCRHLPKLGIRVLRNERVSLGDAGASIDLAGVDDYGSGRNGSGHGYDLDKALAGRDPERELVLLAHQPGGFDEAARKGVGLQLSGHTHGGQIWPFTEAVRRVYKHFAGLDREGDSQIYVSRGTGYWGPPMRLGAPAEITKIILG